MKIHIKLLGLIALLAFLRFGYGIIIGEVNTYVTSGVIGLFMTILMFHYKGRRKVPD